MTMDALYPPAADRTYWENVGTDTRWGRYTTEVVRRAILLGHRLARTPTLAIDLGCEAGRWSLLLAGLGWKMICTDINPETLGKCRQRLPEADCVLVAPGDARIPCATGAAGLLLCVEVPPIMNSAWFVDEAARVLREDGCLVGVFWNVRSLRGLYVWLRTRLRGGPDFYRHAYAPWKRRLMDRGFEMVHEEGYCWFPFRRESDSPLIPACLALEKGLWLRDLLGFSPWIAFVARKRTP